MIAIPLPVGRGFYTSLPNGHMPKSTKPKNDWSYTIEKSRFGLYTSFLKDGTPMTTGMTEESVRWVTDNIRIPVLRGEFDGYCSSYGAAVVEGKL